MCCGDIFLILHNFFNILLKMISAVTCYFDLNLLTTQTMLLHRLKTVLRQIIVLMNIGTQNIWVYSRN